MCIRVFFLILEIKITRECVIPGVFSRSNQPRRRAKPTHKAFKRLHMPIYSKYSLSLSLSHTLFLSLSISLSISKEKNLRSNVSARFSHDAKCIYSKISLNDGFRNNYMLLLLLIFFALFINRFQLEIVIIRHADTLIFGTTKT